MTTKLERAGCSLVSATLMMLAAPWLRAAEYGPKSDVPGYVPSAARVGAYACVVHRAVGFQGDRLQGQRYAGAIKLTEEQSRFTMTVKQRSDGLVGSKYCAEAKPHGPEPDFYRPDKPPETGMRYRSDLDYWFTCKASYELQLSPAKVQSAMRGDESYRFVDHGLWAAFHFFGGDDFVYSYFDSAGNWYMEEGQCQKM